jgi:hypothetical protein
MEQPGAMVRSILFWSSAVLPCPPTEQVDAARRDLAWQRERGLEEKEKAGGVAGRYQPKQDARTEQGRIFESFLNMADNVVALPIDDLITSAGRQRAVLGQRASGLADFVGNIMERLDR